METATEQATTEQTTTEEVTTTAEETTTETTTTEQPTTTETTTTTTTDDGNGKAKVPATTAAPTLTTEETETPTPTDNGTSANESIVPETSNAQLGAELGSGTPGTVTNIAFMGADDGSNVNDAQAVESVETITVAVEDGSFTDDLSNIQLVGVGRDADASGTEVDEDLTGQIESVETSDDGRQFTITFADGAPNIAASDELVGSFDQFTNPGVGGRYRIAVSINGGPPVTNDY